MKNKLKVYFASPLFTDMERDYNKKVVDFLRNKMKDSLDIYLPQENDAINDKSGYADSQMIAIADTKELLESDLLIAVLDGSTIDVETCKKKYMNSEQNHADALNSPTSNFE